MPKAKVLIADKGYDSKAFIQALERRGIEACMPPRRNRKVPVSYDRNLCKNRHKIEDLLAKLKDWRRNAMRYDRYARTFFQAICIAAAVSSCLKQ